jgi:predicted MFS family arabinose efflux permease
LVLVAVSFISLFMAAIFSLYTYLASFLEHRHSLLQGGITAMFLVFGFGAMAGNALGGGLTDRIGPMRTIAVLCAAQMVVMPALTLWNASTVVTGAFIAVWSICGWSVNVPQQARLAALDPVLLALHSAAIYIGSSVGSAAGGRVLARFGYGGLGLLGSVFAAAALLSVVVSVAGSRRAVVPAETAGAQLR